MVVLENFLTSTKEISVQELEYVPYQRLVLAHLLDEECGGSLKKVLVETFRQLIPPAIQTRRKMGFGVPIDHWFRNELQPLLRDVLLSDRRRQTASKLLTDLYQEGFLCAAGSFPGKRVGSPMIRYALTKEPV